MVTLLVQYQADIDIEDDNHLTPLHVATAEGHSQVVEYLLKSGASVNGSKRASETPLHAAAGLAPWKYGEATSVELVKTLLEWKADPTHRNGDSRTILLVAAEQGSVSTMHLLLDKKWSLDVNQRDWRGWTALHEAVSHGGLEATRLLLNQPGIDPYLCAERPSGWSELDPRTKPFGILDLALAFGREDVVRWLVEELRMPLPEPAPDTPFGAIHIVFSSDPTTDVDEKLRYLVSELHIDPHQRSWGPDYQTPLSLAISRSRAETVHFLLEEYNLDPGERCSGDGGTPLHAAVKCGYGPVSLGLVKILLDKGSIDVNALDGRQRTALHCLFMRNDNTIPWEVVRILLTAGAQISLKDSEGCTARDLIPEECNLFILEDCEYLFAEPRDAVQERFDKLVVSLSNNC